MPTLFDPLTAGALRMPNRIVMAPLTRNRSPNAVPLPRTAVYYAQRATAGLLISEATAITQQGQGYADVPGLYAPEQLDGWRRVTDAVHAADGRIVVQLWHVGRISHTSLQPDGQAPVAPSAIRADAKTFIHDAAGNGAFVDTSAPRALDLGELPGIVEDYRRAARAAIDAGFDGVEVHAANGYLIDQFLRSGSNTRTDAYGGSIENRARFLGEVMQAVVAEIGGGRTGIRISPVTPANDAHDPEPMPLFKHVAEVLAPLDLAFVHVIEGATGGPRDYRQGDAPFDYAALKAAYTDAGGKGAWIVNNAYDKASAEAAIASGYADAVAFGRAFIANPDLVRRLREDAPLNELDPATLYGGGDAGYTDYPTLD
ncbi:alkene reductase [Luteimonas sp. 100069]|uniref:alkene reductase n=1 Tax=Luteimonas sp. 100069 TaxID=2006109 RepID=UPI000F511BA8|nr:alkene reductase [Luteimonas sp. 100069]RPD88086.1 alkene reductase [Luteimonas sp. 100069]